MRNNFDEKEFREAMESVVDVFATLLNPEKLGKIVSDFEKKAQEFNETWEKNEEFIRDFNERKAKEFEEEFKKHKEKVQKETSQKGTTSTGRSHSMSHGHSYGVSHSHSYGVSHGTTESIKKETTETKDYMYYKNLAREYAKKRNGVLDEMKNEMTKVRKDVLDKLENNINHGKFFVNYPVDYVCDRVSGKKKLVVRKVMEQLKEEGFKVTEKDVMSTHPYYKVELFHMAFGKDN